MRIIEGLRPLRLTRKGPGVSSAATVVVRRLIQVAVAIRANDIESAITGIDSWASAVDFDGIPPVVILETRTLLSEAREALENSPPRSDEATSYVRRAVDLWV